MKLIDKDALVAEIEKQIELGILKCQQSQENNDRESYVAWSAHIATYGKILLNIIDTLEVKEVDLEKEIDGWYNTMGIPISTDALKETARHFFELGLKVNQKGE